MKKDLIVVLLRVQSSKLACLLPCLDLSPCSFALSLELIIARAELGNSLLRQKLLQSPLFDILGLVFLELGDEGDSTLKN